MMRFLKRPRSQSGRAGIARIGERTAFARVGRSGDAPPLLDTAVTEGERCPAWLRGAPAACVLERERYRLQLVELPRVEDHELRDAMRWQAKDLVDFPLDEAMVDVVRIPPHIGAASKPMGYTAVARAEDVADCVDSAQAASDEVDAVLVVESALENIARLLPQEKHGVALLHFGEQRGYLIISREGKLHLIRRIHHGYDAVRDDADELSVADEFAADSAADSVSLEIQRSLDYYESHYDCKAIGELVMTPRPGLGELAARLRDNLGLEVNPVRFDEHFDLAEPLPETVDECLILAVGAALEDPATSEAAAREQRLNLLPDGKGERKPPFSGAFLLKSAAAAVAAMTLLGFYASRQVDALRADIEFNQRQEETVIRQLGEAVAAVRLASDAGTTALRREDLERDLRQKQALLALLQGDRLGSSDGFSPQLKALAAEDPEGLWLTRVSLRAAENHTRLEGIVVEPEIVAEYVQALTATVPFASEGFQYFRIARPDDDATPMAFVLSGQPLDDPAGGHD